MDYQAASIAKEHPVDKRAIETELRQRAGWHEHQPRLMVDYYRIRRRVSFPLPVTTAREPDFPTALKAPYPWNIWMVWALEERIHALAWSAEQDDQAVHRALVDEQLQAIAHWPQLSRDGSTPDLLLGHVGRLLTTAHQQWSWLAAPTRQAIKETCHRIVAEHWDWIESKTGHYALPSPWPVSAEIRRPMANIPLIGLFAAAMAAYVVHHPQTDTLLTRSCHAMQDYFDHFEEQGYSEAVAYDGYMLDFYANLILLLPVEKRGEKLTHPAVEKILATSWQTAVTGDAVNVAEQGDVEPRQMVFHLSAHAKLLPVTDDANSRWHLDRCDIRQLRSEALVALLADAGEQPPIDPPPAGACHSQNAVVLRSGWRDEDLTAAFSASRSKVGHIQADTGSMVLGTQGQWLISDPGYQQYMATRERVFTLGPGSHNFPVLNGATQEHKGTGRVLKCETLGGDLSHALIDMTACYAAESFKLTQATREIWLLGKQSLVLVDTIHASGLQNIAWSWHGHPDAGWWVENGVATLQLNQTLLWIATHDHALVENQIDRMRGSRGQQTLCLQQAIPAGDASQRQKIVRWWVFNLGEAPQPFSWGEGEGSLSIADRVLTPGSE